MTSMLPQFLFARGQSDRMFGVAVGIVTNNQDPDGHGRVKVKFPWLGDNDESFWARVLTPMAGKDRGLYFLPEIDDEVLVAFEHGSMDHTFVLGALWNGKDDPPESNSDGKNDKRTIKSRSGHIIRLDDKDGDEKIEIIDKTGNNRIVIKASDNSLSIQANGDITVAAKGKLSLTGNGVEVKSQADVTVQGSGNVDVKAGGPLNLKGSVVNLN